MKNVTPPDWSTPEREATSEQTFLTRRKWLAGIGALGTVGAVAAIAAFGRYGDEDPPEVTGPEPWTPKPATSPLYSGTGRAVTPESLTTRFNNFLEFGSHKQIHRAAQALVVDPWTILIDGLVEEPFEIGIDDLIAKMPIEERIYRHRCVEAWSMVVPWIGFPLSKLVELANPLSKATYVTFRTFHDPDIARGQGQHWYPWPYTEGVTMAEATNELALIVVGAYGKVLHKQFGAPLRLHLPWKYGFKSIKSIKRITFTESRPVSFWEELQEDEYGFWANVNPDVDHPRWSQAKERVLGTDERIPTKIFNGYGAQVAHLYKNVDEGDRLWR